MRAPINKQAHRYGQGADDASRKGDHAAATELHLAAARDFFRAAEQVCVMSVRLCALCVRLSLSVSVSVCACVYVCVGLCVRIRKTLPSELKDYVEHKKNIVLEAATVGGGEALRLTYRRTPPTKLLLSYACLRAALASPTTA